MSTFNFTYYFFILSLQMMSTILAVDLAKFFKLDMFDVNDIGKKIKKRAEKMNENF